MNSHYARYPSLADCVVLITGGATGIGATMVEEFAAQAAKVVFLDVDHAAGEALAARVALTASHAPLFVRCDLCDIDALRAAVGLGRRRCREPAASVLRVTGGGRRHACRASRFDHQPRIGELDGQAGRDAGLY